jgi:hypothetical protein
MEDQFRIIGKITPRKDAIARVTGRELYSVDIVLPPDALRAHRRQPLRPRPASGT